LRQLFNLASETNLDLLLCALYHRTFITERDDERPTELGESPFATSAFSLAVAEPGGVESAPNRQAGSSPPVSTETADGVL